MTSEKKPGLLDRAKKLGERLFTKRNMAIAAPIVAGAAALSSKRVRDAVGDAAKSAGGAIAKAAPTRKKPAPAKKPAASTSAKRSAAGKKGAATRNSAPAGAKPAPAKASKPKAATKPKASAKPRAKAKPKTGDTPGA